MSQSNNSEDNQIGYCHIEKNEMKKLNDESLIVGILVKKLGKNGMLEIDFEDKDYPRSVNIYLRKNKLTIYAE